MASEASTISLNGLVTFCVNKHASPVVFHSLLKQLVHKQEVKVEEVVALLESKEEIDPTVVMFIAGACLGEQVGNFKLATVLSNLESALGANQEIILTALITQLRHTPKIPFNSQELSDSVNALVDYLRYLLNHKSSNDLLMGAAGRFIVLFGSSVPHDLTLAPLSEEQSNTLKSFVMTIQDKIPEVTDDLTEFTEKFMRKNSVNIRQSVSLTSPHSSTSHISFMKTNKLPKVLWLNYALEHWKTHLPTFLVSFDHFVRVKTNQNVLNELLTTAFEGYAIEQQDKKGSQYFAKNWELFLLKRVPVLIRELKLKSTESSLVSALSVILAKASQAIKLQANGNASGEDMFASFPSTVTDVRHEFVKSCIALQLLPSSAFNTILKQDAAAYSGTIPTTDDILDSMGEPVDIKAKFNHTVVEVNPEFTSLEDSGLLEFLQSVEGMEGTKQIQIADLILSSIQEFIKAEDSAHLYRLCLGLSLSVNSLHAIVFHLSPYAIIKPIMACLDKWQMSTEETNFQESHSEFGGILLFFMLIVQKFSVSVVDLVSLKTNVESESFCINYLTTLGSSSRRNPSLELNQHKSEVITAWISALFDSGGISDDLMRLSNVQECFELFPIIFQQALIAVKQNLTDVETVKGGLEYFLQPSLLATVVGIVSWCEDYLWRAEDVDLIVSLLKVLVCPTELSGESVHIHRIILSIFGPRLHKCLSTIDSSPTIPSKIDPVFLSSLHTSIKDSDRLEFFEVGTSRTLDALFSESQTNSHASLMHVFGTRFHALLSWGQSPALPLYDHMFLPNMITFFGIGTVIDYLLSQVQAAQVSASKNSDLVIEVAVFILVAPYVGFSSHDKNVVIATLKSQSLVPYTYKTTPQLHELLQELLRRKEHYEEGTLQYETFDCFLKKILETTESIHPLE
ncbi:unnamed protein product [Cyberlindnera jadinii]|uniref:Mediator of RNA polymerase II transcription subunit 5 n=1 Tax=Cyberlindnera jadinii (strain ATCC 18201 / CBS 1600 / BCRC 20928 / JCM 3617 / NBRC 0987 / NRRL Y-1542) TaxID=983966 RepID=A0A0H5C790_CYBJN|nr:unnamed protein product [Cyberlindnera jadinii]